MCLDAYILLHHKSFIPHILYTLETCISYKFKSVPWESVKQKYSKETLRTNMMKPDTVIFIPKQWALGMIVARHYI